MDLSNVTLNPYWVGIAALAGLLSFLSPCVLALVPAYVGYLSGRSMTTSGTVVESRSKTFFHGLAFVSGFSLVFVVGGAAVGAIGSLIGDFFVKRWIARVGGVVVVVFGLHTMGVFNIPFLDYDTRRQVQPNPRLGYLASALMGIIFSAGWAPCIGPVLGTILNLALFSGHVTQGVILLSAYSLGMAVPFLLAALGMGQVTMLMKRHGKVIRYLSIATGVLLVAVGVMLITGTFERLASFAPFIPEIGL
ncbi:MAG TPA: cytochrome c biogenesis protein CcdA [Anaerolineae bacterium]|nr:cytochrome c biogenesis protein CcdA [Anaerolineae bacterium]